MFYVAQLKLFSRVCKVGLAAEISSYYCYVNNLGC